MDFLLTLMVQRHADDIVDCMHAKQPHISHGDRDVLLCGGAASMEGYHRIAGGEQQGTLLQTEQAWLAATRPDLVVSDVVPLACAAAYAAGIPCICVSNFSWGRFHVHVTFLVSFQGF